jgi:hypothetical protein
MSIVDILIILACLAGGYWIVSSVMGPGVDITRRGAPPTTPSPPAMPPPPKTPPLLQQHSADWHLLLDIPRSASRVEIEAAFKRQRDKALAAGDSRQQELLRMARDAAIKALSRPHSH